MKEDDRAAFLGWYFQEPGWRPRTGGPKLPGCWGVNLGDTKHLKLGTWGLLLAPHKHSLLSRTLPQGSLTFPLVPSAIHVVFRPFLWSCRVMFFGCSIVWPWEQPGEGWRVRMQKGHSTWVLLGLSLWLIVYNWSLLRPKARKRGMVGRLGEVPHAASAWIFMIWDEESWVIARADS